MTSHDTARWRELFGTLCVTYDRVFDEAQSRFYFDALKDLDLRELAPAALRVVQDSKWFPRPAEWRAAVFQRQHEEHRVSDTTFASRPVTPAPHCPQCRDTGFMDVVVEDCECVAPCPCRSTNPNYQRGRAVQRQEAITRDEGGKPDFSSVDSERAIASIRDWRQLRSGREET